MSFFKTKKFIFGSIVVLAVTGTIVYRNYKSANALPVYETAVVTKETLRQTVEATGKVQAVDDLALRFEIPGILNTLTVKEGDTVTTGTVLATLRLSELQAAVDQAQANLNQKLAGATAEDKNYYQAAVTSAKAALDQGRIDAANAVAAAESAVATAKNNLKLAEGGNNSQIVNSAYESAVAAMQAVLPKLDDALTQSDNILGIDNIFANDSFKNYLALLNPDSLPKANSAYADAKNKRSVARNLVLPLTTASARGDIDTALVNVELALASSNQMLAAVSEVLKATNPLGNFSQTSLDSKKTVIETQRATITAQYTAVITQKQTLLDAKRSFDTYTIAYNKALKDLAQAEANSTTSIQIKEAAYNQALSNLQTRLNPPREVDVASLRAAVAAAVANRDKAVIRAPIDGVVSKINKKKGEFVSSADTLIQLLSPHFEVRVDIPETDVSKIKIGQAATLTLDAFGSDVPFSGQVLTIDPDSTEIQDVVYYKVRVQLVDTDKPIKPDMTANVILNTAERSEALVIPSRAVQTVDGKKQVRILDNQQEKIVPVTVGLRGDEGKIEIVSGLNEGETVIVSKTEAK